MKPTKPFYDITSDPEEYVENIQRSSQQLEKEVTAQVRDGAHPLVGCISKCEGTYRTPVSWSDGTPEE